MNLLSGIYDFFNSCFVVVFISAAYAVAWLRSFFVKDKIYHYQKFSSWLANTAVKMVGARLELNGLENIPPNGKVLLVSNYYNFSDTLVIIAAIKRKLFVTAGPTFFIFPIRFYFF